MDESKREAAKLRREQMLRRNRAESVLPVLSGWWAKLSSSPIETQYDADICDVFERFHRMYLGSEVVGSSSRQTSSHPHQLAPTAESYAIFVIGAFRVDKEMLSSGWPDVVDVDEDLVLITADDGASALVLVRTKGWSPDTAGDDMTAFWWFEGN
jgi:hypothetical protein